MLKKVKAREVGGDAKEKETAGASGVRLALDQTLFRKGSKGGGGRVPRGLSITLKSLRLQPRETGAAMEKTQQGRSLKRKIGRYIDQPIKKREILRRLLRKLQQKKKLIGGGGGSAGPDREKKQKF